jgi:hypothetical protein
LLPVRPMVRSPINRRQPQWVLNTLSDYSAQSNKAA